MKRLTLRVDTEQTVRECFEGYITKCTVRNLSPQTISTYRKHYDVFEEFLGGEDTQMSEIEEQHIDDFIIYLRNRPNCGDITVNSYLRSIRSFLYYAMELELILHFKIKLLKVEKKIKETYTDSELKRLLKKPDISKCNFTEYKMWAFVNYLIATGNRISSALNLKIKDLDFDNATINITKTKNRKAQVIPMSATLAIVLKEYLSYRKGDSNDYVFCSAYGGMADKRTYQESLAKYNNSRGVAKTSAHLFRHTFAKKWILNGGDIFRLQKVLGHSDLTIVREYVNMFNADLAVGFNSFNPLDSITTVNRGQKLRM